MHHFTPVTDEMLDQARRLLAAMGVMGRSPTEWRMHPSTINDLRAEQLMYSMDRPRRLLPDKGFRLTLLGIPVEPDARMHRLTIAGQP